MTASPSPSTERRDLLAGLADEILHNYPTGRRLIGVDGADAAVAAQFADEVGEALAEKGVAVERRSVPRNPATGRLGVSIDEFRATTVLPFRAGEGSAFLVIDGPLLGTSLADTLAWSAWLDSDGPGIGGPGMRTSADAIIDVTDSERPTRRFSDWCVVPRRG